MVFIAATEKSLETFFLLTLKWNASFTTNKDYLQQWCSVCWPWSMGVKWAFCRCHLRSLGNTDTLWFIMVTKLQLWSSNKNLILWLGVSTTWGTVLEGCSIRKVENYWSTVYETLPCRMLAHLPTAWELAREDGFLCLATEAEGSGYMTFWSITRSEQKNET